MGSHPDSWTVAGEHISGSQFVASFASFSFSLKTQEKRQLLLEASPDHLAAIPWALVESLSLPLSDH